MLRAVEPFIKGNSKITERPPFILVPSVLSVLPLEGWQSW
jgi:hypothetical protein